MGYSFSRVPAGAPSGPADGDRGTGWKPAEIAPNVQVAEVSERRVAGPVEVGMPARRVTRRAASKKRILLTDSSRPFLARAAAFLEALGYEVHTATDSDKAWKLAAKVRPDVAILDIAMKGMGRFDVAIHMGASLATYRILYLFLAARAPRGSAKHSKEVRAVAFMKKPFSKKALLKLIKRVL